MTYSCYIYVEFYDKNGDLLKKECVEMRRLACTEKTFHLTDMNCSYIIVAGCYEDCDCPRGEY